jgi:hypothetical protein
MVHKSEQKIAVNLITAPLPSLTSCLVKDARLDHKLMQRLIIEVITSGLAKNETQLKNVMASTLWSVQEGVATV